MYCIAALGISYDPVNNTQTFFDRHDDDITCIAINNRYVRKIWRRCGRMQASDDSWSANISGTLVATGQMGKEPCVWVWDALNAEPRIKLGAGHLERYGSGIVFAINATAGCAHEMSMVCGAGR